MINKDYITVLGHTISYLECNSELERTVLFIHGNSSSSNAFQTQFELIPGHRIIALDLYGHGKSDKAQAPDLYSFLGYENLVCSFIQQLNLKKVILAGHSLGGHVAIEATANLIDEVTGIIAWGTPPLDIPPDLTKAFLPNPNTGCLFQENPNRNDVLKFINENLVGDNQNHELFLKDFYATDPCSRSLIMTAVTNCVFKNEIDIIRNIKIPTLLLHGLQETIIDGKYFDIFDYGDLPHVEIKKIDSGHYPHIENPKQFANIIVKFLDSII